MNRVLVEFVTVGLQYWYYTNAYLLTALVDSVESFSSVIGKKHKHLT